MHEDSVRFGLEIGGMGLHEDSARSGLEIGRVGLHEDSVRFGLKIGGMVSGWGGVGGIGTKLGSEIVSDNTCDCLQIRSGGGTGASSQSEPKAEQL